MARLTRVHQKVFASNASNNGVFGSLQAGNPTTSNDVATLQSLSAFENGWDDAIEQGDKLPPLEEFQGVQYGISYQQAYMLQEGIAEWDANTPYYKGSLTKTISGTSFKLYCSLADNNTGNVTTNTTYWKKVMDSDDVYAFDSAVVHNTGNETVAGTKTFSSTISGSINGNAATVTNGVYTTGNQTVGGNKTFSGTTTLSGSVTVTGDITSSGTNSFSGTNNFTGNVSLGSSSTAATVTVSSDSTRVATTGYVKDCVPKSVGSSAKPVYTNSDGVITACDFGMPDYANRVEFTTSTYTPTKNGIIRVRAQGARPMAEISLGVFVIARAESTDSNSGTQAVWALVNAGETYTVDYHGATSHQFFFVPFK